jgi:hypothetical protein
MHFQQSELDDYRIYAGAVEAPHSGYIAALIVNRRAEASQRELEAYRDDSLGCGYRWETADQALSYALTRAREMIRKRSPVLRA